MFWKLPVENYTAEQKKRYDLQAKKIAREV